MKNLSVSVDVVDAPGKNFEKLIDVDIYPSDECTIRNSIRVGYILNAINNICASVYVYIY